MPEKAQPFYNFVVIPTTSNAAADGNSLEPIIWTVPATAPKNVTKGSLENAESYEALLKQVLDMELARTRKRVICPDAEEFVSGIVQSHRKGEKAWHVKAFRGSKDGESRGKIPVREITIADNQSKAISTFSRLASSSASKSPYFSSPSQA